VVQHGKLQRFVALLLATREIHVHCAMNECLVQTDTGSLSTDAFGQLCLVTPPLGEGFVEQFVDAHSRDLGWILHHQVQSGKRTLPRWKRCNVDIVQGDASPSNGVAGFAHDCGRKSRLAGSVGTHHRMNLTRADRQVDAVQDLRVACLGVEITYGQHAHGWARFTRWSGDAVFSAG